MQEILFFWTANDDDLLETMKYMQEQNDKELY